MRVRHFGRPLSGFGAKLSRDLELPPVRQVLDDWGFRSRVAASLGTYGGVDVGFCEILTLVCDDGVEATLADVPRLDSPQCSAHRRLRPHGTTGLLLANDRHFMTTGRAPAEFRELQELHELPIRPSRDDRISELAAPEDLEPGELCIVGVAWRLPLAGLRMYVAVRLLETALGSDRHGAVLRPLRDSGRAYAVVTRYFYEIGVLAAFGICTYSPETETLTRTLLRDWRLTSETLEQARWRLIARLDSGPVRVFNSLAPYSLLGPVRDPKTIRQIVDDIEVREVGGLMDDCWSPVKRRVTHGAIL